MVVLQVPALFVSGKIKSSISLEGKEFPLCVGDIGNKKDLCATWTA